MVDEPEDDWDEPGCTCGELGCIHCAIHCHYCDGNGYGIVGVDWDCDDGVNGPFDGAIQKCPCCRGSGLEKDCTFW